MSEILKAYNALSSAPSRSGINAVFNSIINGVLYMHLHLVWGDSLQFYHLTATPFTFDENSRVELIKAIIQDLKSCGSKGKLNSKGAFQVAYPTPFLPHPRRRCTGFVGRENARKRPCWLKISCLSSQLAFPSRIRNYVQERSWCLQWSPALNRQCTPFDWRGPINIYLQGCQWRWCLHLVARGIFFYLFEKIWPCDLTVLVPRNPPHRIIYLSCPAYCSCRRHLGQLISRQ